MARAVAHGLVVASGLWLVALAAAGMFVPDRTRRFLEGFASTARVHYTEQVLRAVAGIALVVSAPAMRFARLFELFGWTVLITAAILMLTPWTWHRRFAQWSVPWATEHLRLFSAAALGLGAFILYAAAG